MNKRSLTTDIIMDSVWNRLKYVPDAINYLAEVLKEEDVTTFTICNNVLKCWGLDKPIDFCWSPQYPTYFVAIGNNGNSTLISFATGSDELRKAIRERIVGRYD